MTTLLSAIRKTATRLTITGVVSSLLISASIAGVRARSDYNTLRAPAIEGAPSPVRARSSQRIFRPGGLFLIARGVVLDGGAKFVLEDSGREVRLTPRLLKLDMGPDGDVALVYQGSRFKLDMHKGVACPLATFIGRGGEILYTLVPPARTSGLGGTGLVPGRDVRNVAHLFLARPVTDFRALDATEQERLIREISWEEWLAQEFAGGPFMQLLAHTDMTREVEPLPVELALAYYLEQARSVPENSNDSGDADGSYVNTDADVTYKVFLVNASKTVDVTGVPLRFRWMANGDTPEITAVYTLKDEFPPGSSLTDFQKTKAEPSHYDVVVFYQTAGIFQEMRRQSPTNFATFRAKACRPGASR